MSYKGFGYVVDSCPLSQEETTEAASKLNCSLDEKGRSQYVCVPNENLTSIVEFCFTKSIVALYQDGHCLKTLKDGFLDQISCKSFTEGCPAEFFRSTDLYKYPACHRLNTEERCFLADPSCNASTMLRTSTSVQEVLNTTIDYISYSNVTTAAVDDESGNLGAIIGVVVSLLILLGILIGLFAFRRRLQGLKCCKRNLVTESEEEAETFSVIRSFDGFGEGSRNEIESLPYEAPSDDTRDKKDEDMEHNESEEEMEKFSLVKSFDGFGEGGKKDEDMELNESRKEMESLLYEAPSYDTKSSHFVTKKPVMDPLDRAQVLLLCDLCKKAALQSHCELCHVNLCIICVGIHLSDSSKRHNVVSYKHRTSAPNYPKCPNHTQKRCELHCEKCDIPVCTTCISSGKHHGHKITDILQKLCSKTEDLEKDLKELEKRIHPTYEKIASDLNSKKVNLENHYEKLTTAVTKQGEDWHREINIIVNKQKSEIDEMKAKHLAALNKQENKVKQITSDVKQNILDLKKILDSSDVSLISDYKSRNAEFRNLPPKVNVTLPSFSSQKINTEQLHQMFGSLSALSITTEEHGYAMETTEAVSCPPVKPPLDEPEVIATIDTGYYKLYSVTCLSDEEIWTCGEDSIMKLYNLQGKLLKSIQTKSGNWPRDIAVTRSGDLVYADYVTRTVNLVKNKEIQEVITQQGWIPFHVCSTSSGDLLVIMNSDFQRSKVVRYSGSTEKQTIQFDSKGQPLYSSGGYNKYISENKNLDICVSDSGAKAVVVVNQAGKLQFRYTGHRSTTKGSFCPFRITTDSQSQILTLDHNNDCIHILDLDGQFLRYIDNCDLKYPWGLCVDTGDNLFVAESNSGIVKKIKYI